MKYFSILSSDNALVASNLPKSCKHCFDNCQTIGRVFEKCIIDNKKRRFGKIENGKGITFLCCDETKTTKLFREKLEALSYAYYDLILPKEVISNDIKSTAQKRVNRLVHNLTSINAHNIQEIYDLIPQSVLTTNINEQIERIQQEIIANPRDAAMMFLRIAKHNIHMKSEFSIYKKLERADPTLDKRTHPIHKVFMNVLHTFFVDFSDKNVYVNVGECRASIQCDYEVIQVALYHIIENSSKYVKPNSQIDILFKEINSQIEISIKMTSLHIEESELDKIFEEGYSGKEARRSKKQGEGIGLWRVRQMLELNDSQIEIYAGVEFEKLMGFKFSENEIIIKLKKY